jgi:TolB protein
MTRSLILLWIAPFALCAQQRVGVFDGQTDIGTILHAGTLTLANRTYTVTASGDNMWAAEDDFHFVWKKVSGDWAGISADISIVTPTGNPHRKAALMIRRTLDLDSDYVDAVVHGNGMTALQSREEKGSITREIIAPVTGPSRLRLLKEGNYIYMMVAGPGEEFHLSGGSMKLELSEPFYIGLAVCAHDKDATVQAQFSNVGMAYGKYTSPVRNTEIFSSVETIPISSPERQAIYVAPGRLESPFWTKDGKSLILTSAGQLATLAITPKFDAIPTPVSTGSLAKIGHHTASSPDGAMLGFTDETGGKTAIYSIPLAGGTPKLITDHAASWFQGWSPNSQTIIYCGTRNGKTHILTMPANGGPETALGTANNNNDSPEYSPDGKFIYFNSDRTGLMQIWRMTADGKDETQLTKDDFSNWFPHLSPDGTQVAYMSYDKGVTGHPNDADVHVRSMTLATKAVKVIANFTGSAGSFHSAAWSPDSKSVALVSYQSVP